MRFRVMVRSASNQWRETADAGYERWERVAADSKWGTYETFEEADLVVRKLRAGAAPPRVQAIWIQVWEG